MNLKETSFLDIPILQPEIIKEETAEGIIYFRSKETLSQHPTRVSDRLVKWAKNTPENTFLGQRNKQGEWRRLNYRDALTKAKAIGQYLINKGASAERPLVILSTNSIEQGIVILAALYAGIPFSPISPAYSTKSTDFAKLKHCVSLLTPGLIFVQNGLAFAKPLAAVSDAVPVLVVDEPLEGQDSFEAALQTTITNGVLEAHQNITPDTVAKVLFTSGSTGLPKGVINTHGNITTNNQQTVETFPFMDNGGFHLIDWLPWNHTFGGNNNFGMALYCGGSLHIDNGNPTPKGIPETIRNLREIAPTIYYNVPKGFEELLPYLKEDKELCQFFFSRLKMFFYAGASMPQHVWDDLEQLAFDTIGKRVFIGTGLGMTEASPSAMFNTKFGTTPGMLGVPVPELEVKLVPDEDKMEARFRGKNLTPGYWRNKEATRKAFDEEGFYKTGDAVRIIDEGDPAKGMVFNGRIAENFKLISGTWVSVGILRAKLIAAGDGLIQDVVITGHDRTYLGAIVILEQNYCRILADLPESATIEEIARHVKVIETLQVVINELGANSTGSSTCIRKAIVMDAELSIDKGEVTDKGSINQRAILRCRPQVVAKLYDDQPSEEIIIYQKNVNV